MDGVASGSPTVGRYVPGQSVLRREVLHGEVWLETPVTVVADDGQHLAVLLEPGAPFSFPTHPHGPHPWSTQDRWQGPQVLQLHRPGDRYAVWRFYDDGVFRYWYVNFEAPLVRGPGWFATEDYGLDLIVHPDGSRTWKDVEHLSQLRREGRMPAATALDVLDAADLVVTLLDSDERWWARWDDWSPGESLPRQGMAG